MKRGLVTAKYVLVARVAVMRSTYSSSPLGGFATQGHERSTIASSVGFSLAVGSRSLESSLPHELLFIKAI